MQITAIIPARYGSTRLPGKALADIKGKPLVQLVYEKVAEAKLVTDIAVATDDKRIADAVRAFGGEVVMTSALHRSGTDRAAEAVKIVGGDIVVNVQGDEPMIEPVLIDAVCEKLIEDEGIVCSTAASEIFDVAVYEDSSAVKVVMDMNERALFFSRSPIPFWREGTFGGGYLHIGIYAYQREFLEKFSTLEQTPLELAEKLEQLRILEHGYKIGIVLSPYTSIGVDTPEDLEKVRDILDKS